MDDFFGWITSGLDSIGDVFSDIGDAISGALDGLFDFDFDFLSGADVDEFAYDIENFLSDGDGFGDVTQQVSAQITGAGGLLEDGADVVGGGTEFLNDWIDPFGGEAFDDPMKMIGGDSIDPAKVTQTLGKINEGNVGDILKMFTPSDKVDLLKAAISGAVGMAGQFLKGKDSDKQAEQAKGLVQERGQQDRETYRDKIAADQERKRNLVVPNKNPFAAKSAPTLYRPSGEKVFADKGILEV